MLLEGATHAVCRVHQGMCVRLHPLALMRMLHCKSPRGSASRPGAMFCSMAYTPGHLKDSVFAERVVRGRLPCFRGLCRHAACVQQGKGAS
jgi:hypothetical protein